MNTLNTRRAVTLVALLALAGAALWFSATPAQENPMTLPTHPQKLEQWLHPATAERATLAFDGLRTTLERAGKMNTFQVEPFDERAALAEARAMLRPMYEWSVFNVVQWRDRLIAQGGSTQAARAKFQALGFPLKFWHDLDAYQTALGRTPSGAGGPDGMPAGYTSITDANGVLTVNGPQGTVVIRPDDPVWQENLLLNPTPELKRTFEELYLQERISVAAPPADATFFQQRQALAEQGFIRLTTRRPDGSVWLPDPLEPYRPALQQSERPVLRLSAERGRTAQPWDSKVGGVPYRLKGAPWLMTREVTPRPLVFLAQINFAQVNGDGRTLPDFPRRGLLQFFILNSMFYGADDRYDAEYRLTETQRLYRVLYLPDIMQDTTKLDDAAPEPVPDELNQLDFSLPFTARAFPPGVPLRASPDREPVSGADRSAITLLGLPSTSWDGTQTAAGQVIETLYATSPEGHKVGGYPNFTQADPRREGDDVVLLLQLDSDDALGLAWGDGGTANFFIHPDDLKARDFSRVMFNWDSG